MSTIVRMAQGSPEWHEHRRKYRNASETPAVLGVSPWQTPYQLWQLKLGLVEQEVTPAMTHGSEHGAGRPSRLRAANGASDAALGRRRRRLQRQPGRANARRRADRRNQVPDQGPRVGACGRQSRLAQLPEHYRWQVQHQLMVARAEVADVFVFDGSEGILLEVAPEPSTWPAIHEAWNRFWEFLRTKTPPPLSKGDVRERDDPEWRAAATEYLEAKKRCDEAAETLETAKRQLTSLATHTSEKGAGVTVARFWKRGNVDYKRIPAIANVDLDTFRGPAKEELRILIESR